MKTRPIALDRLAVLTLPDSFTWGRFRKQPSLRPAASARTQVTIGGSGKKMKQRKDVGIPPEEFEKAFGDDFWDRPVEERFQLLVTRMLKTSPKDMQENDRRHSESQDVRN